MVSRTGGAGSAALVLRQFHFVADSEIASRDLVHRRVQLVCRRLEVVSHATLDDAGWPVDCVGLLSADAASDFQAGTQHKNEAGGHAEGHSWDILGPFRWRDDYATSTRVNVFNGERE